MNISGKFSLKLLGVYITEKTVKLLEQNKITFKVSLKSSKIDIRNAVEEIFGFYFLSISLIRIKGKQVRKLKNKRAVYRSDWKKAIVCVKNVFLENFN